MPWEGNQDMGVSVPQHPLMLSLQVPAPGSNLYLEQRHLHMSRQTEEDRQIPRLQFPCCPELLELPGGVQDPSAHSRQEGWLPSATTAVGTLLPSAKQVPVPHLNL